MNRQRLLLIAIALALVGAGGAAAWTLFFRPVSVQVTQPGQNVVVQVFGLGTVEARVTSKVGFKVSGVLVDLRADVGDRVAKGAVLARLDDREQTARVGRAKAATEQAEANLQRAMANVQKAQANYANAKTINERRQKLVQSATTSIETAETAKTAQDAALADVNLADERCRGGACRHRRRQGATAAGKRDIGFSHSHGALRCHGDRATEGARFRSWRRRAGVHADRSQISLGACLYRREQSRRDQSRRAGRNRAAIAAEPAVSRAGCPHRARKRSRQRRAPGRDRVRSAAG